MPAAPLAPQPGGGLPREQAKTKMVPVVDGSAGAGEAEWESSLYSTDDFRMHCFKVLPCSKRFCHDWTTCPFAHPGEKARRRDPRVYRYTGIACPEMKTVRQRSTR
ncbi:unnamed protein product [Ostreobium quekettii]|uniref:AtC3H23-like CCCH zinc finger domain-containing protein n=1 Tax=Ostreobium quekettii TaxID=121088 RepID=A0A8S1IT31_9CHLO|nr:unnamed protein product [Ostreobium quekettii]